MAAGQRYASCQAARRAEPASGEIADQPIRTPGLDPEALGVEARRLGCRRWVSPRDAGNRARRHCRNAGRHANRRHRRIRLDLRGAAGRRSLARWAKLRTRPHLQGLVAHRPATTDPTDTGRPHFGCRRTGAAATHRCAQGHDLPGVSNDQVGGCGAVYRPRPRRGADRTHLRNFAGENRRHQRAQHDCPRTHSAAARPSAPWSISAWPGS